MDPELSDELALEPEQELAEEPDQERVAIHCLQGGVLPIRLLAATPEEQMEVQAVVPLQVAGADRRHHGLRIPTHPPQSPTSGCRRAHTTSGVEPQHQDYLPVAEAPCY